MNGDLSEFERVERPTRSGRGAKGGHQELYRAIAQTAIEGGAVRVPLNGTLMKTMQSLIYAAMNSLGLRAHTQTSGETLIAWAERRIP